MPRVPFTGTGSGSGEDSLSALQRQFDTYDSRYLDEDRTLDGVEAADGGPYGSLQRFNRRRYIRNLRRY